MPQAKAITGIRTCMIEGSLFGRGGRAIATVDTIRTLPEAQLTDRESNTTWLNLIWKSAENAFGVLLQAFSEERHSRRDGQELFGYSAIQATDAIAVANPSLVGVLYPQGVNSECDRNRSKRATHPRPPLAKTVPPTR